MIAVCNICKTFEVPWDEIGQVLMAQHLKTEHAEIKYGALVRKVK